jgi:uncharacterized repeat protein (TIGR01451 family)
MSRQSVLLRASLLFASVCFATSALAQQSGPGCIELKTEALVEESYLSDSGESLTRLVPAAKVVPGDEVVWTITASNVCGAPVADVAITNPVPRQMTYVDETAFGSGTSLDFSVDGDEFAGPEALRIEEVSGEVRPARAEEYKHVRWLLDGALEPQAVLVVGYRARVQ